MLEQTKVAGRGVMLHRMKRLLRFLLLGLAVLLLLSAIHRLVFQFRPIPVRVGFSRAMTPAEKAVWVALWGNSPAPDPIEMLDSRPYPDPTGKVRLAPGDLFAIRAMASWTSVMPWRSIEIEVRGSSEVILHVFERNHSYLYFTKIDSGWHMKPTMVRICHESESAERAAESAKPVLSFH